MRKSPFILALVLGCLGCKATSVKIQSTPEPGTIAWHVQQAKGKGETNVSLVQFPGMGAESNLNDEALAQSTIVFAIPISSAVQVERFTVGTWYKFKVTSVLAKGETCALPCNSAGSPPSSLLPLAPNEIAVPLVGGTANLDGVTLTVSAEKPHFKINDKYVLFLDSSADSSQVFFLGGGGYQWAFKVDDQGTLHDESFRSSRLAQQVMTLHTEERLSKQIQTIRLKRPAETKQ